MMKKLIACIFVCIALLSCKPNKKTLLERTWRANILNNPQMNDMMASGQMFIDTVGSSTDAATNMELYGTTNIDSLKKGLQTQLDSVKTMQQSTVQQTVFTFRKDSVAILSFNGNTDSSRWYLDDKGAIVLDEMKDSGPVDQIKMEIVALSDTALQLNFQENGINSLVTFHPDRK